MSLMMFSIQDAAQSVHSKRHAGFVDVVIPALSDDPETIAELQHAMQRFLPQEKYGELSDGWSPGPCDAPLDGGLCLVDLAARLIVFQSTAVDFIRLGEVTYGEADADKSQWIPYRVSDEWRLMEPGEMWSAEATERRQRRQANPPWDSRAVLYGQLASFIVDECLAARGGSTARDDAWTPPPGWQWRALPERAAKAKTLHVCDAIAEIHARWLMTPRDDLRGKTPRELLHERRSEIAFQLQDRQLQWARSGQSPLPLWRESIAYQCGGYGTHEIVVYYELVRQLIHDAWDLLVERRIQSNGVTREAAIERLGAMQQEWLHTPNDEEYRGRPPIQVIERERLRLPMGASGEEAMIDCDCPMCRMMAEGGPVFWELDGSHLDQDFPFAVFETTREEWESTQDDWTDLENDDDEQPGATPADPLSVFSRPRDDDRSTSVWQRSYSASDSVAVPALAVMGLACHLAELIDDIRNMRSDASNLSITGGTEPSRGKGNRPVDRAKSDAQAWIDTLNRDFSNLRDAVSRRMGSLIEPVASRFSEHLLALAETRPALTVKCLDLDRQINALSGRISGASEAPDDESTQ